MTMLAHWCAGKQNSSLSILKDPFFANRLYSVRLCWHAPTGGLSNKPLIYAAIKFENGDTKGEQEIHADSMDELISRVKAFLESLPKKGQ